MSPPTQYLFPFVYWAQRKGSVTLKIELKQSREVEIKFTDRQVNLTATGIGSSGGTANYHFMLDLYEDIDSVQSIYRINESNIFVTIAKLNGGKWWPRVTAQPQKPHWLKIDFERWTNSESDEEQPDRDIRTDYPRMYDELMKRELGYRKASSKTVYLIFYNFFQFTGHLYILFVLTVTFNITVDALTQAHQNVGNAIIFCSLLQFLEVMHSMFGYVNKTNRLIVTVQTVHRNFMSCFMINGMATIQSKPIVFYTFVIWTIGDCVRYPYYLSRLLNHSNYSLTWLRYTIWIVLDPCGIVCESMILLLNLLTWERNGEPDWALTLPNRWNIEMHTTTFLKLYQLAMLPSVWYVCRYMLKQRKEHLKRSRTVDLIK